MNPYRLRQQARTAVLCIGDFIDTDASQLLCRWICPQIHGVHLDERPDAVQE